MGTTATQLSWGQRSPASHECENHRRMVRSRARVVALSDEEASAFRQLYEQSAPRVLRTLCRITRNREDAEDALEEAFLNAFLHARDFDGRSSFSTWFTRIAINSALMILRKKRTHPEQSIDGADADGNERHWVMPETTANPEKLYGQSEQAGLLKAAVGDLRPAIRKVVEVGQLQERSMRETADALGISLSAAKARLFHARAALRKSRKLRSLSEAWFPGRNIQVSAAHRGVSQQRA
jgi:RNA polymerase sigma factor (sigma-70 family)